MHTNGRLCQKTPEHFVENKIIIIFLKKELLCSLGIAKVDIGR